MTSPWPPLSVPRTSALQTTVSSLAGVTLLSSIAFLALSPCTTDAALTLSACIVAISAVGAAVAPSGRWRASLAATAVASASVVSALLGFVACGQRVSASDAVSASAVAAAVAHAIALFTPLRDARRFPHDASAGPLLGSHVAHTAITAGVALAPLALLGSDRGSASFPPLVLSAAGITALSLGAMGAVLAGINAPGGRTGRRASEAETRPAPSSRVPPIAALAALAAALGWLVANPVTPTPTLAWLLVPGASAAIVLALLADVLITALVTCIVVTVSWAAAALASAASAPPEGPLVITCALSSTVLVQAVLQHPGATDSTRRRVSDDGVRLALACSLGLSAAALLQPSRSVTMLSSAFGLALFSWARGWFDVAIDRLLSQRPPRSRAALAWNSTGHISRFKQRFRHLPPWIRFPAMGKLRFDPMFGQLGAIVPDTGEVLDLGAGYGLVATWITTARPSVKLTCVEPSPGRAAFARHLCENATVVVEDAASIPDRPRWAARGGYQAILLIDVIHHVADLDGLLACVRPLLAPSGSLIIRSSVQSKPARGDSPWQRWERILVRLRGQSVARFRTADEIMTALAVARFGSVRRVDGGSDSHPMMVASGGCVRTGPKR